jgi:hypothetical protein
MALRDAITLLYAPPLARIHPAHDGLASAESPWQPLPRVLLSASNSTVTLRWDAGR